MLSNLLSSLFQVIKESEFQSKEESNSKILIQMSHDVELPTALEHRKHSCSFPFVDSVFRKALNVPLRYAAVLETFSQKSRTSCKGLFTIQNIFNIYTSLHNVELFLTPVSDGWER